MPKISIIVPVYKAEAYLHRCVDSILSQTYTDWELLLIDDGSPDRSGEICDEYAKKDQRIRVFHKKNGGVSSARNLGLDNAKGAWCVFVDSDDWCEPNYISDFFVNVKLEDGDIALQGRKNEVEGKVISSIVLKERTYNNIAKGMLENELLTFGAPYCKLYSRKVIKNNAIRFPEEYSYGEDTTFFFKVLSAVNRMITLPSCNYHYVDAVNESLSKKDHDFAPLAKFMLDSMDLVKTIDKKSGADDRLIKAYLPNYRNLLLRSIANMYRLGYNWKQKKACFERIKEMLSQLKYSPKLLWILRLLPTVILIILFNVIMKFRCR